MKEKAKVATSEYNALSNDKERFKYLKEHNDLMMVYVDNDAVFPAFRIDDYGDVDLLEFIDELELNDFDGNYWCEEGICALFAALGINAKPV